MNYKMDFNRNQLTAMLSVCDVYSYLVNGDFNLAIKTDHSDTKLFSLAEISECMEKTAQEIK